MHDFLRLVLLIAIAAAALTVLGAGVAYWMEERRRLTRLAWRVLGGEPDAVIIAQGRDAAAAFRLEAGQILVMRFGGGDSLLYKLTSLMGAELIIDDQVVARVARGEAKRALDQAPKQAEQVVLRLMFDDVRYPEFALDLWLPSDENSRHARPPAEVVREARAWLNRAEALLRRTGGAVSGERPPEPEPRRAPAAVAAPVAMQFDIDESFDDEPFDDEPELCAEREAEIDDDGDPFKPAPPAKLATPAAPPTPKPVEAKIPDTARSEQLPLL